MKKIPFLLLFICLVLTSVVSGCAAFRRTFSRTPESMRRTPPPPKKAVHRPGSSGDQLFDTVFRRGKTDSRRRVSSSALSEQEKAMVDSSFNALPRGMNDDADVRRIREQDQKTRTSRRDHVFGTHNGSYLGGAN